MLTTIKGTYKDGHVELEESPAGIEHAEVLVTFLPMLEHVGPMQPITFGMFSADGAYSEDEFHSAEGRVDTSDY